MAPNIDHVTTDIRVPPIFITDFRFLKNFPELICDEPDHQRQDKSSSQDNQESSYVHLHAQKSDTGGEIVIEQSPERIEVLRHDKLCSSMSDEECNFSLVADELLDDQSWSEEESEHYKHTVSEKADDLLDDDYVLPANTEWWKISPTEEEEFHQTATPGAYDVVDVPHFGDDLSNSQLWDDVDTFVSVLDTSCDDVTEEHQRVYCLDTRMTTVWGLDIIWEQDEDE